MAWWLGCAVFLCFLFFWKKNEKLLQFSVLVFFGVVGLSLLSNVGVAYIRDDTDHFYFLGLALHNGDLLNWISSLHNEHFIPWLKVLYWACFKWTGMNPWLFHLMTNLVFIGVIAMIYSLVRAITSDRLAAVSGAVIFASCNLFDGAIAVTTDSHILYCLLGTLGVVYCFHRHASSPSWQWRYGACAWAVLAFGSFALCFLIVPLVVAHYCWLTPPEQRRNNSVLLGLLLLLALFVGGIYANQFSAFSQGGAGPELSDPLRSPWGKYWEWMLFLGRYLVYWLVPGLLSNGYFSFGLFFSCVAAVYLYPREQKRRWLVFFLILGLVPTILIFFSRINLGENTLYYPRYFVYPAAMLSFVYALLLSPAIKRMNIPRIGTERLVLALCALVIFSAAVNRYKTGDVLTAQTSIIQAFYRSYHDVFSDFFSSLGPQEMIIVKNPPVIEIAPWSRYVERLGFFAPYLLAKDVSDRIMWSHSTDQRLLDYLYDRGIFFYYDLLK
jgi:hypothetical protein